MRLQITVLYIRCEMAPTYAGGEQQKLKKGRGNIEII